MLRFGSVQNRPIGVKQVTVQSGSKLNQVSRQARVCAAIPSIPTVEDKWYHYNKNVKGICKDTKKDYRSPEAQAYLRSIIRDPKTSMHKRAYAQSLMKRYNVRNECFITGQKRGYVMFEMFGMNRHFLRNMSYKGLLPGVRKYSW